MQQHATETGSAGAGNWQLPGSLEEARAKLHREPFMLSHELHKSDLFDVRRLIEVAKEVAHRPGDVYFDAGDVGLDDKWGKIPVPQMPVDQVLERIENCGAWVILKHVEKDPAYARVLDECARFVHRIAGPEGARDILNPEMLVIVSSPGRITPFHFDAEINFLVQCQSEKQVWICDPADRSVLTEEDIEHYYTVSHTAGKWNPEFEKKARHFTLKPGSAVHIPSHAAHWVRNGSGVSVSLSLNFEHPGWRYRDVYLVNQKLRKLGINPTPPGRTVAVDKLKAASWSGVKRVGKAVGLMK